MEEKFRVTSTYEGWTFTADQPKASGGDGEGPAPPYFMLFALASCMCTIARIKAHQEKIELRSMDVEVSGGFDTDVLLGKNTEDRAGFPELVLKIRMDADLSDEEKMAFLKEVERRCPISDNIDNATSISIELA
jgi:uncharacterized OsmC-like protein